MKIRCVTNQMKNLYIRARPADTCKGRDFTHLEYTVIRQWTDFLRFPDYIEQNRLLKPGTPNSVQSSNQYISRVIISSLPTTSLQKTPYLKPPSSRCQHLPTTDHEQSADNPVSSTSPTLAGLHPSQLSPYAPARIVQTSPKLSNSQLDRSEIGPPRFAYRSTSTPTHEKLPSTGNRAFTLYTRLFSAFECVPVYIRVYMSAFSAAAAEFSGRVYLTSDTLCARLMLCAVFGVPGAKARAPGGEAKSNIFGEGERYCELLLPTR